MGGRFRTRIVRPMIYRQSPVSWVPAGIISIGNRSLAEGDSGSTNMAFTVTVSPAQAQDIRLDYWTSDGTATAGVDYTAVNSFLVIAAGITTATINVPILGDTMVESDETFSLSAIGRYQ